MDRRSSDPHCSRVNCRKREAPRSLWGKYQPEREASSPQPSVPPHLPPSPAGGGNAWVSPGLAEYLQIKGCSQDKVFNFLGVPRECPPCGPENSFALHPWLRCLFCCLPEKLQGIRSSFSSFINAALITTDILEQSIDIVSSDSKKDGFYIEDSPKETLRNATFFLRRV